MANNKLSNLSITFIKRNARLRGPTSSEMINDSLDEISHDFNEISTGWNNSLMPLFATLPDGSIDTDVNAFSNGLNGKNLFVDSNATALNNNNYFNATKVRPRTVFEQFEAVYNSLNSSILDLKTNIDSINITATSVSIADPNGYFVSSNVENALAELKQSISFVTDHGTLGGLDDDDHVQYLNRSGSRPMEGPLNMGENPITDVFAIQILGGMNLAPAGITLPTNARISWTAGPSLEYDIDYDLLVSDKPISYPPKAWINNLPQQLPLNANQPCSQCIFVKDFGGDHTIHLEATDSPQEYTFIVASGKLILSTAVSGDEIYLGSQGFAAGLKNGTAGYIKLISVDNHRWFVVSQEGVWSLLS